MSDQVTTLLAFSRERKPIQPRHTVGHRLELMLEAWRTRHILAELDPRLLKDIGISRGQAQAEVARAPWDIALRR